MGLRNAFNITFVGYCELVYAISLWIGSYCLHLTIVRGIPPDMFETLESIHYWSFYLTGVAMLTSLPFIQPEGVVFKQCSNTMGTFFWTLFGIKCFLNVIRFFTILVVPFFVMANVGFSSLYGLPYYLLYLLFFIGNVVIDTIAIVYFENFVRQRYMAIRLTFLIIHEEPVDWMTRRKLFFNYLVYNIRSKHSILIMPLLKNAKCLTLKQSNLVLRYRAKFRLEIRKPHEQVNNERELATWIYNKIEGCQHLPTDEDFI